VYISKKIGFADVPENSIMPSEFITKPKTEAFPASTLYARHQASAYGLY